MLGSYVTEQSLAHKGRAHVTKASWYLAASLQAVITSNYQYMITLSTRNFFLCVCVCVCVCVRVCVCVWLLHPIGGEATYVVFICDHAIITGFPDRNHV